MRRFRLSYLPILLLVLLVACSGNPAPNQAGGPRLVEDVALNPTEPLPSRVISATPLRTTTAIETETPTATLPTLENISPLEQVTVQADFVLVTPTLPPSKTPTETPTVSATPTLSPTPTTTVTATATAPAFPTSVIAPVTAPVVIPQPVICDTQWFFIQPRPESCPASTPTASRAVYQQFENGYMIWIGELDAIYVMYNDLLPPRWEVWVDEFDEGEDEYDPNWPAAPSDNLWQPRRGFGQLWRREQVVRDRIGWAIIEDEIPYSSQVQLAQDGTLFLADPEDRIFALIANYQEWQLYLSSEGGFPGFDTFGT